MRVRFWCAGAVAVTVITAGVLAGSIIGLPSSVSAAVAIGALLAVLIIGQPARRWIPAVTAGVAATSLTVTVIEFGRPGGSSSDPIPALASVFELAGLLWLFILLVRRATVRQAVAVGALTSIAELTLSLRAVGEPSNVFGVVAGMAFYSIGTISAVLGGLYLRTLDAGRAQAVAAARRAQRVEVARDLHDYVAHDVSGIIVQAQAAQVVADSDPRAVVAALRRIEEAGLQALASMDQTVRMLRETSAEPAGGAGGAPNLSMRGINELADVIERFSASGAADAHLDLDPALAEQTPREVGSTIHRIVVEALTNVRRHAPGATTVDVRARVVADNAELTVRNDASLGARPIAGLEGADRLDGLGGLGLAGLQDRVAALGGTLTAGPVEASGSESGWQVRASLPLSGGI